MSSNLFNVLITGANRGIGLGLTETYLSRPNTTVIVGVRDPSHSTTQKLSSLSRQPSSNLIVVKIVANSPTDAAAAIETLKSKGIEHLDLVIANAGISNNWAPIASVDPEVIREHLEVNGFGALYLFQATVDLLRKTGQGAKFVGIGSPLGSIGGMHLRPYPTTAYGVSKTMQHYIIRKVHFEHEGIISLVVDPGFVQTDMGNAGAVAAGMEKALVTIADSVAGIVRQIDVATKEDGSGDFKIWTGESFPW